jgi:hypothetical protein
MIIYNVTVKIEDEVEEDWLQWMQDEHIPDVMDTGLFEDYRLCRLLLDEDDGTSYAIQYFCKNMEQLEKYQEEHAEVLQQEHHQKYKDQYVAFRTLLEVID